MKLIHQYSYKNLIYEVYDERPSFNFKKCNQTHSNLVFKRDEIYIDTCGDGIVSALPLEPIAVVTADCLPIILIGKESAAIVHAGWKGLANSILNNDLIKAMNPEFAYIGPHISWDNYEVQEDFKQNFPESQNSFKSQDGKFYFSLEIEARRQIVDNYGPITIESSKICTYDNESFHSFRKNKTDKRNWNILRMEKI